ncbi:dATP/dGTP pyrophosphohydrolase domain-containing protein [Burkholderia dolosa]|uniref:dATP/dGTP pyrophosphohydrolase domain-containing protein n=1 Tax=Burkholderia dolosa TaxID=152500 RepID=UPI0020139638|nr:dATP/dGTP pyrophosphohydrolase domain-containing protein [Burkholderia dolosa]
MTTNENPAAIRVCAIADIQCSRGCGTGPCKREAESSQPAAAPIDEPACRACDAGVCSVHGPEQRMAGVKIAPSPADERAAFDILAHLQRQREFSERTFGPGARTAGICDHIRKELKEIEANPGDLTEWIDVVILALDGAWRAGGSPQQIIDAIVAKQTKNEGRTWPDWRTVPADKAIEHDRSYDACPQCHGKGTVVFRDPEEAWDVTCGACEGTGKARASANETGALGYAQRLATSLWEKHWRDSASQWKVLDDTLGVLTQIDNMVCGLHRVPEHAAEPVAVPEPDNDILLVCGWENWCTEGYIDRGKAERRYQLVAGYILSKIAAPQPPAQADAREGLTDEQRTTIQHAADKLRTVWANHTGDKESRELCHKLEAIIAGANHV